TLKAIANNEEVATIWRAFQDSLQRLRQNLNELLYENWDDWQVPHEAENEWSAAARKVHAELSQQKAERQKGIDASIAANADLEILYDKPYIDKSKVRVAGPFTVESLSPHRVLGVDADDELIDRISESGNAYVPPLDFGTVILEYLKKSGVQQA